MAFSDAVFAIASTLLVLDLRPPEPGRFVDDLLADWPTYLAYLTAFLTIGSIWLSHHNAYSRVRQVDPVVLLLNLLLLLGASLVPWPTALISTALRGGNHDDQVAAILVYSLVTVLIGLPWSCLSFRLARRPWLLGTASDAVWMRRNARYSSASVAVAVVGASMAFVLPIAALVLYVVVPAVFLLDSVRTRQAPEVSL